MLLGNTDYANQLVPHKHCPEGGARLQTASACFACSSFMGRTSSGVCFECLPDERSEGIFGTGESCSIPCVLGERPIGTDQCTECKSIAGTFHNVSIVREEFEPTTWIVPRCESCRPGAYADETGAVCIGCSRGQFARAAGSSDCEPCGVGTFSETQGSTSYEATH